MARYRIDAVVESDRDEENLGLYAEGVLEGHFRVKDLSVYEICHLPSDAERAREARRAEWTSLL